MATSILPGEVVESSSLNAYGHGHVKFQDGTYIYWTQTSLRTSTSGGAPYNYRGSASVSFDDDVEFIDDNIFAFARVVYGGVNYSVGISSVNRSGYTITAGANANVELWPYVLFIGRWK